MFKKLITIALLAAAVVMQAQPHREHRALWLTAFLGEWPSGALTSESAVNRQVKNLQTQLDDLKANNYNTIYFHVRSHCDAMYESSYEPWAACVGGSRGTAPIIDPLATIIEECHKRGIELYAWINPYRYAGKSLYGGNNEKNYETSHPDWLLTKEGTETILNPGLPQVRQRIVDVTREIITKYDVDGVVFDDYFYTNGTSLSKDADLYNAYKASGGTLAQADWRRANVNAMVRDVRDCIASTKPYLNFGISPAGPCNPPNIADYGLPASTMSDWQYNGIYSDPVAWLNEGIIDMVSPQVYRTRASHFLDYSEWWVNTANHFGRNISVSSSTSIIDANDCKAEEFIGQQEYLRTLQPINHSGLTIFGYSKFQNYREKDPVLGQNKNLAHFMGQSVYTQPALQVTRPWRNAYEPRMVSNITVSGTSASWTPAREGDRYTVYDLSAATPVLLGVTYTPSYNLPEGSSSQIGVCVYDRYGNEYSMLEAGKSATAGQAPRLVYPAAGGTYAPLSNFRWEGAAQSYTVVIAKDGNDIMTFDTEAPELPSSQLLGLKQGQTYSWRVISKARNSLDAESASQEFTLSSMQINTPAAGATNVAECAQFDVTKAADGAVYTIEISTSDKFSSLSY
ncbi:MAG: family 10 glycosylhydrolase, partial [Muribaculaceae bacterium]|nr:family 10 glycosylhydrolase [Muribaculaceae bacterium]